LVRDGEFRIDFAARSVKLIVEIRGFPSIQKRCQQKSPKAERILTFTLCNFSAKGGSPCGGHFAMLYSLNRWGELMNIKGEEGKFVGIVVNVVCQTFRKEGSKDEGSIFFLRGVSFC